MSFNSYFVCYILYIFVCVIYLFCVSFILNFLGEKHTDDLEVLKKHFQKIVCVKYDILGIKGVKLSN